MLLSDQNPKPFDQEINTKEQEIINSGLELEEDGEYEMALKTWERAYTDLTVPSFSIAREYIRLVTEQEISSNMNKANSMYFWGLTAREGELNSEALRKELDYISVLIGENQLKSIKEESEENVWVIADYISAIWRTLDPTPTTRFNERLIEHWDRIAYSRRVFDRSTDSIYGTDDRGPDYVRYGRPQDRYTGNLMVDRSDISVMCSNLRIGRQSRCGDEDYLFNVVQQLDSSPAYEIWVYPRPSLEMKGNMVLIFAEGAEKPFRKVNMIEDMIPSRAFTTSQTRYNMPSLRGTQTSIGTMSPGMALQYVYYMKLSKLDMVFGYTFNVMNREWAPNRPEANNSQGIILEERRKSEISLDYKKAPEQKSTYEETITDIPVYITMYRTLSENGNPDFITILQSDPYQSVIEDLALNDEIMLDDEEEALESALADYELKHGIQILNDEGIAINQVQTEAPLIIDPDKKVLSNTYFRLPYQTLSENILAFSELRNLNELTKPIAETPFPESLRGSGKDLAEIPNPLDINTNDLLVGDLIIGYEINTDREELLPFIVSTNKIIPKGTSLAVHLEIYNLQLNNGLAEFQLDYEITEDRSLKLLRGRKKQTSLRVNFNHDQSRFVDNLEIQTRELEVGDYQLKISLKDLNSDKQWEQIVDFNIEDK